MKLAVRYVHFHACVGEHFSVSIPAVSPRRSGAEAVRQGTLQQIFAFHATASPRTAGHTAGEKGICYSLTEAHATHVIASVAGSSINSR